MSGDTKREIENERVEQSAIKLRGVNDLWVDYDPEAVRAAIEAAAGTWADIDGDELIRYIYESRELGTKQRDLSWADELWGETEPERDLEAEWLGQWDEL